MRLLTVPLVSEMLVLAVSASFLSQLPGQALRWMGLVGGILIAGMAWRTWRQASTMHDGGPDDEHENGPPERLLEGIALALLSPAPWVFWFLLGGPLFLNFRAAGWSLGIAFAAAFVLCFVGALTGLAALASYGQSVLDAGWQRRILRSTAVVLVCAGAALAWQSWAGNFHRMVEGSLDLTNTVEEAIDEGA